MALYYHSFQRGKTIFYTDHGSLSNILAFANPNECIRYTYLLGKHELTNKLLYLRNGKASAEVNSCLKDYLISSVQQKLLFDSRIIVREFDMQFYDGTRAYTDKGDIIVELNQPERITSLLAAFKVPLKVCPALLSTPGVLFNVTPRTGSFVEWGYFKKIEDWLNLHDYEKEIRKKFKENSLN